MPNHKQNLRTAENGIVSIVVTMLIMMVLTLIVVGFARLSRREQQQSLDRQLNTQAFYAAESAVNDTKQLFEAGAVDPNGEYTDNCGAFITAESLDPVISPGVEYTCLFVDPSPPEVVLNPVETSTSKVFAFNGKGGTVPSSITITWSPAEIGNVQASCPSTVGSFPANWPNNCKLGILRVDLVPMPASGQVNRAHFINNTFTGFLYPSTSAGNTVSYASGIGVAGAGVITSGACNSNVCSVTITGLTLANNYMRIRSIYKNNNVTITATNGAAPVQIAGAQAVIDATGKANDVLRRIQVRLALSDGGSFPENALQTGETICKRYGVAPPNLLDPDNCGLN